jgi:hypothetical protein
VLVLLGEEDMTKEDKLELGGREDKEMEPRKNGASICLAHVLMGMLLATLVDPT